MAFLFFDQFIIVKFYVRVATLIIDDKFDICSSRYFGRLFVVP